MDDRKPQLALLARRVGRSARWAVVTLVVAGAAWAARAVWQIRLAAAGVPASGPPDRGDGRHRPLTSLENSYHFVSALGDAAVLLCAAAFLAWLLRIRDNAAALSGRPPRHPWPWVYAGWVTPVANLWLPRSLVVDVHRAIAPGQRLPRCVNWWWGLWLAGSLSAVGLMYCTGSTDSVIERAYTDVWQLVAADAMVVGAAVAATVMVRTLTTAQQSRTVPLHRPRLSFDPPVQR